MSGKIRTPVCKKCSSGTVVADAGVVRSIPYYYCRACRIEVDILGHEVLPLETEGELHLTEEDLKLEEIQLDELFKGWRR